jgi:thioredoxin-like negative regulator of GroEL
MPMSNFCATSGNLSNKLCACSISPMSKKILKQQFSITNVPTLVVFKDGKEVQREEGELQAQELRILLKHYGHHQIFKVILTDFKY